jgi:hypothetical protein
MQKALWSKVWKMFCIVPNALLRFAGSFIDIIPSHDLTVTRIGITEIRIRLYWETHGHLPNRLSDLPRLESRDNATIDGRDRPIHYDVSEKFIDRHSFKLRCPVPMVRLAVRV